MKISVVLPTYNEMSTGFIQQIAEVLSHYPEIEKIAVDRRSSDGTREFLEQSGFQVFAVENNTRAGRLNAGIAKASGEVVVLHHPRSVVPRAGWDYLLSGQFKDGWGGFTHQFDRKHYLLNFTSWYSNYIRRRISGVLYLDHCFVVPKKTLEKLDQPWVPDVDIFEDTEFSYRLKKIARPKLIPIALKTSAVRFSKNGIWKQAILNQGLKFAYHIGIDPLKMNALYEKGLNLNSKYKK
jgi:glycosyltransferase involved in cell wall biosynthesis